jgi:hypothetical protein
MTKTTKVIPMRGSRFDVATRARKLAAELRLDINTERHWNATHPDEEPLRTFDGLDPDLGDAELLAQLMAQENAKRAGGGRMGAGRMADPLFFGCWGRAGHYLFGPGGSLPSMSTQSSRDLCTKLDGSYAPRRGRSGALCWRAMAPTAEADRLLGWEIRDSGECPQGQFLHHHLDGFSLIQWWDRCQGDTRPGCNSTVLLVGEHDSATVRAAARKHFPEVLRNLERHCVELLEVTNALTEAPK